MDINRMKLGLVYIFSESDKLGKESKLQLINFIENATEHQLKALALDGRIMSMNELDSEACSIIDDRFNASSYISESLKKASLKALTHLVEDGWSGASAGASAGALMGFLGPIPFGMVGGAVGGAAIGAVLGAWKDKSKKKVMAYCGKQYEPGSPEYKHCLSLGSQAIKQKIGQAKAKAQAKK